MAEARLTPELPERFALLYDHRSQKFETPLDGLGLADIDSTFELAIRTYPGNLDDLHQVGHDRHHLYWTKEKWKDLALNQETLEDSFTVYTFRNSAPQIAYVPRPIHEWIENSQIPPPIPSLETMRRRNLAWQSASLLLSSVIALDKARTDYDENKGITRTVLSHIPGITPVINRLSEIPLEQIKVVSDEYWLSELEGRLESWRYVVEEIKEIGSLCLGHGILEKPNLSEVRKLGKRVKLKENAFIPSQPDLLVA